LKKVYLESERLVLREFTLDDFQDLLDLDSDPEVMKYLTFKKPTPPDKVRKILNRFIEWHSVHGGQLGFWVAEMKSSQEFIGWFHLRPAKNELENTKRLELGYRLKKSSWGQGFATEGTIALIEKAFVSLKAEEVFADTMKKNIASQRVMEKSGLSFETDFYEHNFPNSGELEVRYSLKRVDFNHEELDNERA